MVSSQIEEKFGEMFRDHYEWEELEKRKTFPAPSILEQENGQGGELYLPGGGIAKSLYEDL